jgi:hypothetical protein
LAIGCSGDGSGDGNGYSPSGGVPPGDVTVYLTVTVHLEGWQVEQPEVFTQYAAKIREYSDFTRLHGATFTWETANLIEPCFSSDNLLYELQHTRHDGVGVHADLGGRATELGYTQLQFNTELAQMKRDMEALGVTVVHVSGICSELDWIDAAISAGFKGVTGTVEYCLKSLAPEELPSGYEDVATCTNPSECHDPYPGDPLERLLPYRVSSGTDWTTPDPGGRLILFHSSGAVPCLYESAQTGGGSHTRCVFDQEDITQALSEIDFAVQHADPTKLNTIIFTWSIGSLPPMPLLGDLLDAVKKQYVDTRKVVWKTLPEMIELYEEWEEL